MDGVGSERTTLFGHFELVEDDTAGLGVHIGARIAALAGAGEVFASQTVKDLVVGSELGFEARGRHELKGVPGEWDVYAVTEPAASS